MSEAIALDAYRSSAATCASHPHDAMWNKRLRQRARPPISRSVRYRSNARVRENGTSRADIWCRGCAVRGVIGLT